VIRPLAYWIRPESIEAQKKPPAQLLIEGMVPITDCGLSHLRDERLGISQKQVKSRPCLIEFRFHNCRIQPASEARALHDCPARGRFAAHEKRHTHDAFVADHRNFCGGAILHDVEQGYAANAFATEQTASAFPARVMGTT
jgi:hypothetical protein